jgi:ABC-2 type transport system permease protein
MWKSIRLLTWFSFCNLFGINEARFSKDPKKKNRLVTVIVAMTILLGMLVLYAGALTFAFIEMEFTDLIPTYLGVVIALITFMFTVFRAGPTLFSLKQFEMLSVLPVKPAAIVISRFLTLYITDLSISLCSAAAVLVVCACNLTLSPWFYISMLLGSLFLPLLPMTAAMIVGTGIYALTASMKRKNLAQTLFSFAFLAVYFVFVNSVSDMTDEALVDLAEKIRSLEAVYPPARWFSSGVHGNALMYLLFFAVSLAAFLSFALIVGKFYRWLCTHLTSNAAKGKYVMKKQKGSSALRACFFRERKRYFSSSVYFMNTAIGYIMAVVLVAMLAFGDGKILFEQLPSSLTAKLAPFCIAAFANMMPITSSAISMEGNCFWLTQTLPVRVRDIANAKILVGLMFSVPCMLISAGILAFVIRPDVIDLCWMIAVSLIYAVLGTVLGLFINMKLPMLNWDHEAQAVKQGKAALVTMFTCFMTALLPAIPLLIFRGVAAHIALLVICLILFVLVRTIYRRICAFDLKKIAED